MAPQADHQTKDKTPDEDSGKGGIADDAEVVERGTNSVSAEHKHCTADATGKKTTLESLRGLGIELEPG